MKDQSLQQSDFLLYKSPDGSVNVDVLIEDQSVWLNSHQMAELFDIDRSGIVKHVKNVYKTGELQKNSTCAKIAQVTKDGKKREMDYYNLDMIISVGYRVNSKRGTQFRMWATNLLRHHLLDGYTLHQKRLQEKGYKELQQAIDLICTTKERHELSASEATGILDVITGYMQTWLLLRQYDEEAIAIPENLHTATYNLTIDDAREAVVLLKLELMKRGEASELFGQERGDALASIVGNIAQTFDGKDLYPTTEEKAAHLLYFVIKDHPFSDGNKRSGVLLFLHYLDKNRMLQKGEYALRDTTLASLALLIAESDPKQKDVMLCMIMQFLSQG